MARSILRARICIVTQQATSWPLWLEFRIAMLLYELHITGGSSAQASPWGCKPESKQVPSTLLRGHKCIEKLIHGLSWLTVLLYTYTYTYIQAKQQMSLTYQGARLRAHSTTSAPCESTPQHHPWKISSHSCQLHQSSTHTKPWPACAAAHTAAGTVHQKTSLAFLTSLFKPEVTALSNAKTVSALFTPKWRCTVIWKRLCDTATHT